MLVIILAFVLCVLKNALFVSYNFALQGLWGRVKKCLIKHFGDLFKGTKMICSAKH